MTELTTTNPGTGSPGGTQPSDAIQGTNPDFDPMLGIGQQATAGDAAATASGFGPLSPGFQDPNYDPEEWERLPRRTSFAFRLGVIAMIILLGGAFLYSRANSWLDDQIDPPGLQGDRLVLEVPSGATGSDVMRILADAGVISNSTVAQYWIRANDVGEFQAGEYEFRENSSFDEAVEVLNSGPLPAVFKRLTLPEGLWSGDMRNVMLDNLALLDPFELDEAMNNGIIRSQFQPTTVSSIEGLMFPATYQISEDESSSERAMVQRLVNTMDTVVI
ncbi:MAG: endolytic transglycosylase MltG, partial [Acidimicrobiales bacterium]